MNKLPYEINKSFLRVETRYNGNNRFYSSEGNGYVAVPSVTTMISAAYHTKALDKWLENNAELSQKIREEGTQLHTFAENTILNKNPEPATQAQKSIKKFLETQIDGVYDVELGIAGKLFGGRIDCIGVFNNKPSLIDFKTTQRPKERYMIEKYFVQGVMYCMLLNEAEMKPCPEQIVIVLVEPNGHIDIQTCSPKDSFYVKMALSAVKRFKVNA